MELTVRPYPSVLVLPNHTQQQRKAPCDTPPTYDATISFPDLFRSSSSSSSFSASSSSSSSLSLSSSCSPSWSASSFGFSPQRCSLTAHAILSIPSSQRTNCVLTSLTAKLVANESLAHNNGAFEQNCPVSTSVTMPIPPQLVLRPGQSYKFSVDIPCPSNIPPSVQLADARVRYKVRVKAKVQPVGLKSMCFGSLLQGTTLTSQADLLVLQEAEVESSDFSNIKYVSTDNLGSVCISINPSPCVVGQHATLSLTMADAEAKAKISNVELGLIQETRIRSRQGASSASSWQYKPRQTFGLDAIPLPGVSIAEGPLSTKSQLASFRSNLFEAQFKIPILDGLQSSTLPGSDSVIRVSHHLQLIIRSVNPEQPGAGPTYSHACSWPVVVAFPAAIPIRSPDDLPPYTPRIQADAPHTFTFAPPPSLSRCTTNF